MKMIGSQSVLSNVCSYQFRLLYKSILRGDYTYPTDYGSPKYFRKEQQFQLNENEKNEITQRNIAKGFTWCQRTKRWLTPDEVELGFRWSRIDHKIKIQNSCDKRALERDIKKRIVMNAKVNEEKLNDYWKHGDKNPDASLKEEKVCEWRDQTDEYGNDNFYTTSCDESWYFSEGDFDRNRVKYCPYCGGLIKLKGGR